MGKYWVGHIVQAYYPADDRVRRQAEALVEAGYHVEVICLKDHGEKSRDIVNGVHVYRVPLPHQRGSKARYVFEYAAFFALASAAMVARLRKFKAIHISNLPDFLVFSTVLPKLFGAKILLDEHDPMSELFISKFGMTENSLLIRLLNWQERISIRFATAVLTVNGAMRKRIEKIADKKEVSVVMNFTETHLFTPPEHRCTDLRPDGSFTIIYAGTVTATYGLSIVIEAAANLKKRIPGLRVKIVGGGDNLYLLQELAKERGVSSFVEFTGPLHYTKIPSLINESDVGIATLKSDVLTDLCFNGKSVEYLAMGLPAVIVRTSSYEQTFPEGTVRFYKSSDQDSFEQAIIDLYENPILRAEMSRRGIEFSKTANWSTEKEKYVALVDSLCKQNKPESKSNSTI